MVSKRVVIVGAGLAGLRTSEELRRAGFDGDIVLIVDERHLPYDRPPLTKQVIRGERDESTLKTRDFFDDKRIELRVGTPVVAVDHVGKSIRLADDTNLAYDQLIIATGLRPRWLPTLPRLPGVHVLRSFDDCLTLRSEVAPGKRALIVGGGFIGCELAASLRSKGLDVVVVEPQSTPLESVLGDGVGRLIARLHRAEGVDLRCGTGVRALIGDERVAGVLLDNDAKVDVDIVVIAVGSQPATEWLYGSGIDLAARADGGGVVADSVGRTNVADVWAVGDVAAWHDGSGSHRRVEHWSNVGDQARIVAKALVHNETSPTETVPYFWSDQYDLEIQALGTPAPDDTVTIVEDDGRAFLAYYSRDGILTAVVGAGMPSRVMQSRAKVAAGVGIGEALDVTGAAR